MRKKAGFAYKGIKFPKTRKKGKGYRKAGNSKSSNTKKKALEKINKQLNKKKKQQDLCPICLEKMSKKDRVETICGHFFHKNCIQGWCIQKAKNKEKCFCPVCKTQLPEMTELARKKIILARLVEEKQKKLDEEFAELYRELSLDSSNSNSN